MEIEFDVGKEKAEMLFKLLANCYIIDEVILSDLRVVRVIARTR